VSQELFRIIAAAWAVSQPMPPKTAANGPFRIEVGSASAESNANRRERADVLLERGLAKLLSSPP
jgi:hypothetical protein